MLRISSRPCILGQNFKGKADKETALTTHVTLELEQIKLEAAELNSLLDEPHAWQVLYNTAVDPIEPYLKCLKALELSSKIEGARVELRFGLDKKRLIAFAPAVISKIKLEPQAGGETWLSLHVKATPDLDQMPELLEHLNATVDVDIVAEGFNGQADLPINKFTDGGDQKLMSNMGKQIQAHAEKTERKKRQARKDVN